MAVSGSYYVAAAYAAYSANEGRKDTRDAKRDRAGMDTQVRAADAEAIQRAGKRNVMAQRALRKNSLFTGGGDAGAGATTLGV
jgi:hypothetical protein